MVRDQTPQSPKANPCRQAEAALVNEQTLFHHLLDSVPFSIYVKDLESRFLTANINCARNMGATSPQEVIGKTDADFYSPETAAGLRLEELEVLKGVPLVGDEKRVHSREGLQAAWLTYKVPLQTSDGTVIGLLGYNFDITEYRRAEEISRKRSHQLEVLARVSRKINAVLEIPTVLRQLVAAALKLTGAGGGAAAVLLDGKMVFEEYHKGSQVLPVDYCFSEGYGVAGWVIKIRAPYVSNEAENDPHVIPEIQKALGFRNLVNVPVINRQGDLLGCFEIHNKPGRFDDVDVLMLQGLAATAANALDNSSMLAEHKRTVEALATERNLLRTLVDLLPASVYVKDCESRFLVANPACATLMGAASEQELIGKTDADFYSSEAAAEFRREELEVMEGIPLLDQEQRLSPFAGAQVTVLTNQVPRRAIDGTIIGLVGTSMDITEYKKVNAERELLSMAIEQAAEVVVITDAKGYIQYVNPEFEALTGYTREEVIGQTPRILKSDQQDSAFYREMWETISRGKIWQGTLVNRKKDGTHFTESATISPVLDAAGTIINFVAVKRDITYELALKAQFDQSQKMESVGRLAGGVAHDFNNMLGVILGHTELAMEQMDPAHPLFANLQEIRKAADRSADLTRQLLAFSRQQTISPKVLDLSETIAGMLKMLSRLIGEDIQLVFQTGKSLWPVKLDPSQLDQVLVNLCVNARDAIADVGTITIEAGNSTFDLDYCATHPGFVPGEYVRLTVSDTGCGMHKETMAHMFEPFFTTKEMGKGTGLGLATVFGIVNQNRGFINVYSEPDEGTSISIYLARHLSNAGQEQSDSEAAPDARGHETILLVEDEPTILSMTKLLLERQGYTVLAANTPANAIRLAREHASHVHLLMTDVIMPEMNGRELAANLQASYPHLQLLFMSGYTASVIAHHGVLDPDVCFIQKPFSMHDLAATVRKALDQAVG